MNGLRMNYDRVRRVIMDPIEKNLIAIGYQMENEIKMSFTTGSGREYKRGGKIHVASAPGDPPAVDTGRLRASISTNWSGGGERGEDQVGDPGGERGGDVFKVVVGTNVKYAPFLEFGTSRMAARPFIRPIFEKYAANIIRYLSSTELRKG
jgi:HK97 gp10 family phage protein